MNRPKSQDLFEYFCIFMGIVFLVALFRSHEDETEKYSNSLYVRLNTVLQEKNAILLRGNKIEYFVIRSLMPERIEVYRVYSEMRRSLDGGETLSFLISPKNVKYSRAICVVPKDYSIACESEDAWQKMWIRDIDKLSEVIDSAEVMDITFEVIQVGEKV